MEWILIIAIIVGFYMAWNIGANDVANSMGNAVGAKALTIVGALILAGVCEFAGAVLVGSHVSSTISKGIIDSSTYVSNPYILAYGLTCALLAAATWLHVASYFGMPVSTTHSIVGAVMGFGIYSAGLSVVNWVKLGNIVLSWFISPLVGGFIAFLVFKFITKLILSKDQPLKAAMWGLPVCMFITFATIVIATIYKGLKNLHLNMTGWQSIGISSIVGLIAGLISIYFARKLWLKKGDESLANQLESVEKMFALPVIITSCAVAFAHGANDVANAVGPMAAVFQIIKTWLISAKAEVPFGVLLFGGIGIVIGLATFGYRVMRVIGMRITDITPSRGVAADIGTMITVLTCSKLGLPISTTHTLVGAILGVAFARGITAINIGTVRSIFTSWFATVPVAAGLAMGYYALASFLFIK